MVNKLVSVVVTTRNRASLVQRAINSVLNQSYQPIELIVVDDCSNDNTEIALGDFSNQIIYLRHKESKGGAAARMTGAKQAKGSYIAFLDDDDEWYPTKIEKQCEVVKCATSKCAVITCGASVIIDGTTFFSYPRMNGPIRTQIFSSVFKTIPSNHFFQKNLFDEIGGYDLDLPAHNEHDIWMKLARANYETKCIKETLVIIREDDRERMMTDVNKRLVSFKMFNKKWRQEVYKWYGYSEGGRLFDNYLSTVYMSNANMVAKLGDLNGARKFSLTALKYLIRTSYNKEGIHRLIQAVYYLLPKLITQLYGNTKSIFLKSFSQD